MKINQPYLLAGRNALQSMGPIDPRPIETIKSVINSIVSSAQTLTEQTGEHHINGNISPTGAFSVYYAALLLISHGDDVLQEPAWLQKVETLRGALRVYASRWKLAGKCKNLRECVVDPRG